ncbi:hypothetical protein BH09VER1_BH09VER1_50700 [soil metagenome]
MCKTYKAGQKRETVKAGQEIEFEPPGFEAFSDTRITPRLKGKWAGSATFDRLETYWLSKKRPGNQLVQITEDVAEISETDRDTGEDIWAPAPHGTRLFFILEAPPPGKSYRLARLVTTKATAEQREFFRQENDSVPLTGRVEAGQIIPFPLPNPPPRSPKPQAELF